MKKFCLATEIIGFKSLILEWNVIKKRIETEFFNF